MKISRIILTIILFCAAVLAVIPKVRRLDDDDFLTIGRSRRLDNFDVNVTNPVGFEKGDRFYFEADGQKVHYHMTRTLMMPDRMPLSVSPESGEIIAHFGRQKAVVDVNELLSTLSTTVVFKGGESFTLRARLRVIASL